MSKPTAAEMAGEIRRWLVYATPGVWNTSPVSSVVGTMISVAPNRNVVAVLPQKERKEATSNAELAVYLHNRAHDIADALEENGRLKAVIGSATYCKRDAEDRLALLRVDYERLEADNERYANSMTQLNTANKRMHAQIVGLEANVALMAQAARENGETAKALSTPTSSTNAFAWTKSMSDRFKELAERVNRWGDGGNLVSATDKQTILDALLMASECDAHCVDDSYVRKIEVELAEYKDVLGRTATVRDRLVEELEAAKREYDELASECDAGLVAAGMAIGQAKEWRVAIFEIAKALGVRPKRSLVVGKIEDLKRENGRLLGIIDYMSAYLSEDFPGTKDIESLLSERKES